MTLRYSNRNSFLCLSLFLPLGLIQMRILSPAHASLTDCEEYFTQVYFSPSNFFDHPSFTEV